MDNRVRFGTAPFARFLVAGLLVSAIFAARSHPAAAQVWPNAANPAATPPWTLTTATRGGPPPQTSMPAVVRVIAPERDGASLGSGTLVDVSTKHGLILTNWHVVKDAAGNVIVSFPDGFQSPGYVLKMDRDWDLAAVAIWRPNVAPVPIAIEPARPGDMLTIAGYGSGNFRAQSGRCTQYLSPGPGLPFEMVEVHAAARHGDSGGPILNTRGELAGVLFGEGGGETSGSYCGRVRVFLQSLGGIGSPALPQNSLAAVPVGRPSMPVVGMIPPPTSPAAPPLNIQVPPLMNPLMPVAQVDPARPGMEIAMNSSAVATGSGSTQSNTSAIASEASPVTASIGTYPSTGAAAIQPRLSKQPGGASPTSAELPGASPAIAVPMNDSVGTAAPGASSATPTVEHLTWEDIAGHTWGEQIKTVLAGMAVVLLVLQVIRWVA